MTAVRKLIFTDGCGLSFLNIFIGFGLFGFFSTITEVGIDIFLPFDDEFPCLSDSICVNSTGTVSIVVPVSCDSSTILTVRYFGEMPMSNNAVLLPVKMLGVFFLV